MKLSHKIVDLTEKKIPASANDVVVVTNNQFTDLIRQASESPRNRTLLTMHSTANSKLHSMVNVVSRGSYVAPHKHWVHKESKLIDKGESFMALQGQGKLIFFDDQGNPNRVIKLDSKEQTMVWIPEGAWHTLVATSEYLIVFENKTGPWKEGEDKVFHEAYPLEGEEGVLEVLKKWEQLEL